MSHDVIQNVTAVAGFAYGVVGADIHVFSDRGPVYLLAEHRPSDRVKPDTAWLLAQPSRLLNVRFQLVDFTGRESEQAELAAWRDATGTRLAARWLYGPGGQGKTRLAAEFAARSVAAGWKVVTVTHGTGAVLPPPGSHDLRQGDAVGLLVVVDYADRWPLSHLTWLFSNSLLRRQVPTRLLLLARSPFPWPPVRAALDELQAATDERLLRPIESERQRMFAVARDCFAACYGVPDPTVIEPSLSLDHPDFGLVLTLHMAALAAVDTYVQGNQAPDDPAGLSAYLLDRERRHWTQLYENQVEGLDFRTPPETMTRVVFTAALTGATGHPRGKAIVRGLDLELPPDRVLDDHTTCYPPAEPGTVLEPLYPDRLAEDFIALALPGHTAAGHPPRPWAFPTAATLALSGPDGPGGSDGPDGPDRPGGSGGSGGSAPAYIARTITFLAAAADRWPHVTGHLSEILEAEPRLAVDAGTAALTTLAELNLDPRLLEAMAERFPDRHVDLDVGIAAVSAKMARSYSAETAPLDRAVAHFSLVYRMVNAGLYQQALAASEETVRLYRQLAETDPAGYELDLAQALHNHGNVLGELGHWMEALAANEHAVAVFRRLAPEPPAGAAPGPFDSELATCLMSLGNRLSDVGRQEDALAATEEAATIYRRLAAHDPASFEADLADAFGNLSIYLSLAGRETEALGPAEEALAIHRRLATRDPAAFEPGFATFLANFGLHLTYAGRADEALEPIEEAVAIHRRLAAHNPAAFEAELALSLHNLGLARQETGQDDQALATSAEAVGCYRQAISRNPGTHEPDFATSLTQFAVVRAETRRELTEALRAVDEAIGIYERLATALPAGFEARLRRANAVAADVLEALGRTQEAAELRRVKGLDDSATSE